MSPNQTRTCPNNVLNAGTSLPAGALDGLCPACLLKQGAAEETATQPESAPFQPPSVEEVARLFPQLEILAFIGKGGMGAVYKARQPVLDRIVALKILPPQVASGAGFAERFNREARALARLNHPNIVAVHEFGQVNGQPYFLMEFVDGLNLRQLERAGKLSPREALQIVPQICEALQFAHDEGIVHRDIKPENILLDKKGRVKIADFGIAKIMGREADAAKYETAGAIGTPHYMAPEQVERPASVDHRADIFALGVVFYEMLTGELPLGKFAPPSTRKVDVDVRLDNVVLRALEKEPERRYQHASQVKTAVETIASTSASAPPPNPEAFAQTTLARDYDLDIGSCLRRGWALVRNDFWPLVGVTALFLALMAVADGIGSNVGNGKSTRTTSALALLLNGPLMGGLYLHFLKKIRGERATVEMAFSGFTNRFLHLFLGSFVTMALTTLGFFCLILPGIYLLVAWLFTLPLIIDRGLEFWPAMELSRKMISKHWWSFLGFGIALLLLCAAGLLVFIIGFFIAAPIALAALMYAYEDLFSMGAPAAMPSPAGSGPSGTSVLPGAPSGPSRSGGRLWKLAVVGLALVALVFGLFATKVIWTNGHRRHWQTQANAVVVDDPSDQPQFKVNGAVVDAVTGKPIVGARVVDIFMNNSNPRRPVREFWTDDNGEFGLLTWNEDGHDIAVGAAGYEAAEQQYPMHYGDGVPEVRMEFELQRKQQAGRSPRKPPAFGPVIDRLVNAPSEAAHSTCLDLDSGQVLDLPVPWPAAPVSEEALSNAWKSLTPAALQKGIDLVCDPDGHSLQSFFESAISVSNELFDAMLPADLLRNEELNHETNPVEAVEPRATIGITNTPATYLFKTSEGNFGILQITEFTDSPRAAKLRYKMVVQTPVPENAGNPPMARGKRKGSSEILVSRLEAADLINDFNQKDDALSGVAIAAAREGDADVAKKAVLKMTDFTKQSQAAQEAARQLAKRGLRKQAIDIAKTISDFNVRDRALLELSQ